MTEFIKVINDHIEYLENLYSKNILKIEQLDFEIENSRDDWHTKAMIIHRLKFDNEAIWKDIEKYRRKLERV